jgi:hypothetical protein
MIQTQLDGVPAPEHLGTYLRTVWRTFFRQMGTIARSVHDVRGPHFGPVNGPGHRTWSEAVIASLEEIAAELDGVGLDAADAFCPRFADAHREGWPEFAAQRGLAVV